MSIQAVGWALDQDLPARPKLVLVSIANHANHADGYCFLRVDTIAREASCSPRAVHNFIGDLIRNGFVRKQQRRASDGRQRCNDYWILFGRQPAEWIKAGTRDEEPEYEGDDAPEDEPQDVVEPTAQDAVGESGVPQASDTTQLPALAVGPTAPACSHKDSAEPSESKPEESALLRGAPPRRYIAPKPPPPQPMGSVVEGNRHLLFVRFGTPAYDAWAKVKAAEKGMATWSLTVVKDGHRGWYFSTLFPPQTKTEPIPEEIDPPYRPIAKAG